MDPYELKDLYGDIITSWGGLGFQSTILNGTPEEIKSRDKKIM